MSNWYNLKVGSFALKYMPLNPIEKDYPYCDKEGNVLKKVSGKFEKGYFINEATGDKLNEALRLINNKPYAKLQKTKEATNYKEVEISEVEDLLTENMYLVECDALLRELNDTGKAFKFGFCNGNGYKACKAYVYPSKIYKGYLFMALGRTQISELICEIDSIKKDKKKAEQIATTIQGIDRAKVEDLIAI
jgi:hypothetical protein